MKTEMQIRAEMRAGLSILLALACFGAILLVAGIVMWFFPFLAILLIAVGYALWLCRDDKKKVLE